MGDDDAVVGAAAQVLRQDAGDVFVGEAVAVALDAGLPSCGAAGRSVRASAGCVSVESGVETGHLRHAGQERGEGADAGDVVGAGSGASGMKPASVSTSAGASTTGAA